MRTTTDTETTDAGEQHVLPSVAPISPATRVQQLASLPYSHRMGRAEKAKPLTIGLFDLDARAQIDWLDRR
jgi:hypothetical protein